MKNLLAKFNKAFENRVRLGIMSVLVVNDHADFNTLKELLQVTDGNLASHLRALEELEFITIQKQFIKRKPNTQYKVTAKGKTAFQEHIRILEQLLQRPGESKS